MSAQVDVARLGRGIVAIVVMGVLAACQPQKDVDDSTMVVDGQRNVPAPAGGSNAPDRVARKARSSTADMQTVEMMDRAGFGAPVLAGTVRIPAGWRPEGGIEWDRSSQCVSNYLRTKWRAVSEDGSEAFELMPGYTWQVAGTEIQMNPCPVLRIRTAREFLGIVAQRYPDARQLEYRDRSDLLPKNAPPNTNGASATHDVGELRISYLRDGRETEELLFAVLTITEAQGNVMVGVPVVYAQRAPKGRLDASLGEHIRQSLQPNRDWVAMMMQSSSEAIQRISADQRASISAWHSREMSRINARGAMDRSRIAMQTNREVAQIYSDGWQRSQDMGDRIQRRTLESIGGYNTYNDPAGGGTVRESIEYDRVLRTENGGYISTNDPSFNPAGSEELDRIP